MNAPNARKLPAWMPVLLVALLAGASTLLLFNRNSWEVWTQPHWLEGDPLEVYGRVKIAAEQPWRSLTGFNLVDRLGAPVVADWYAYPVPDRLVFVLTGRLARLFGLIAAIKLVAMFFTGLNAASFYLCARWLRCRWEWAAACALAFAFCTYNVRWGITLSLSLTFAFPPLILLCAHAARRGVPEMPPGRWMALAVLLGLWLGQANPYLSYFAGVVAGGALLLAVWRGRPRERRFPLVLFLGTLLLCFLASNAQSIALRLEGGAASALQRSAADVRIYALRPLDWLVPPADHRVPALGAVGRAYFASRQGIGEFFYNYLGLLGLAGLAGLIVSSIRHLVRQQWRRCDALLGLLWITAFGIVGGINTWLGAAGLELFRASTRIGIFAQIWVLLFLCGWLSRRTIRFPRPLSFILAAIVALAACWEQTPPLGDHAGRIRNQARWERYENSTALLERSLPPQAAVFQLPVVPFPEAGRTGAMPDYEHLLPFLTSNTLRFSYGHLRETPALLWSRYVSRLPAAEMIAALEKAGFSALWLDERAYADQGQALTRSLRALGRPELIIPDEHIPVRVFRLHPSDHPVRPDFNDPRFRKPWDGNVPIDDRPLLLALNGWFPLESGEVGRWRWTTRQASLGIWARTTVASSRLRFRLDGDKDSIVTLSLAGREIRRLHAGPETQEIEIPLAQGLTVLEWRLQGTTFKPGGNDPRELGFMVENLTILVP